LHLSNAFASKQFSIGKLINLPWFIKIISGSSESPYDPDALAWFSAVEATGSTITSTNKTAFNTAFLALKSNNIWDKITQGCFFVGIDGANPLTGAFTPFKTPDGITPTNVNFTTSDYNRLTGIVQDGGAFITGTKGINTQVKNRTTGTVDNPSFPFFNRHFLVFNNRNDLSNRYDVGSLFTGGTSGRAFQFRMNSSSFGKWFIQNGNFTPDQSYNVEQLGINNGSRGFYGIQYIRDDDIGFYSVKYYFESDQLLLNGSPYAPDGPDSTSDSLNTSTIMIPSTLTGRKRIAFYSLGFGLEDVDGDQGQGAVTAYNSIINTLLSSLV